MELDTLYIQTIQIQLNIWSMKYAVLLNYENIIGIGQN